MLLNILLETHAWASARPKHEAALEGRLLEDQIAQIMDTEREQGMCSPTPSSSSLFRSSFVGMPSPILSCTATICVILEHVPACLFHTLMICRTNGYSIASI